MKHSQEIASPVSDEYQAPPLKFKKSMGRWDNPDAGDVFTRKNDSCGKHLVTKRKQHDIIAP
ncbi:hypothetical protein [Janthinobacterium sp. GB4P2]|uniref:hypothetical protein n=1 Tax=Janthinobacterium sp. GB4P2 TaxID=3424189 RepID=UPI003F5219BD